MGLWAEIDTYCRTASDAELAARLVAERAAADLGYPMGVTWARAISEEIIARRNLARVRMMRGPRMAPALASPY